MPVGDGINVLEIKVAWPAELFSPGILHKACNKVKELVVRRVTHVECLGFSMRLRGRRERIHEKIRYTERIRLPFRCYDFSKEQCYLGSANTTTRIVYGGFRAIEERSYAFQNPTVILAQ